MFCHYFFSEYVEDAPMLSALEWEFFFSLKSPCQMKIYFWHGGIIKLNYSEKFSFLFLVLMCHMYINNTFPLLLSSIFSLILFLACPFCFAFQIFCLVAPTQAIFKNCLSTESALLLQNTYAPKLHKVSEWLCLFSFSFSIRIEQSRLTYFVDIFFFLLFSLYFLYFCIYLFGASASLTVKSSQFAFQFMYIFIYFFRLFYISCSLIIRSSFSYQFC